VRHLELLVSCASILCDGSCHHFKFLTNELMLRHVHNVENCGRSWRGLIEVISPATLFCAIVWPTLISRNTFDNYILLDINNVDDISNFFSANFL
jgi:hypothetical protein